MADYCVEERIVYTNLINILLKDDPDLKGRMPINPLNHELFDKLDDGVIMCKLMFKIDPTMMGIHISEELDNYKKRSNFNLAIMTASSSEIRMSPNSLNDFMSKSPEPILNFLFKLLLKIVSKKLDVGVTPEIVRLGKPEEFKKLSVEAILIRWMNYHLKEAGNGKFYGKMTNLGDDLKDVTALFYLLNQLDKEKCPVNGIDSQDLNDRAKLMLTNA